MKILVSGFDPFGGEQINPAWEAVKQLPTTVKGAIVKTIQIPTVFNRSAKILQDEIDHFKPDVVLCIGQAGGRFGITLERVAINIDDARIPDNDKQQPIDSIIQSDGLPAYFSTLPVKAMVDTMKQSGIPASVSNTAGTFVCNHIMYQVLYYLDKHYPSAAGGFIHVPFIPGQVVNKPNQASMALEDIVKGLVLCLETIVTFDGKEDIKSIGGETH